MPRDDMRGGKLDEDTGNKYIRLYFTIKW